MLKVLLVGQLPIVVYVTTCEVNVLAAKLISPVVGLIDKPAVPEKVPPATPVIVGEGLVPDWQ